MKLIELIPPGAETGTGLALEHRGCYLFDLAGWPYVSPSGETFFAGIGGHCEPGESWLECAEREAREELGCAVCIRGATQTFCIGRDLAPRPVAVDDEPRPLCIYELWNPPEAPWNKRGVGYVYHVVVYAAALDEDVSPHPVDVDALLWLTPKQASRTLSETLTLQALLDDGAAVEAREPLPGHWTVRPQGTAHALSILWASGSRHGVTSQHTAVV